VPKLNETQKAILILSVGAVLAIGGGVGAYSTHGEIQAVEEEITKAGEQYKKNDIEIKKIDALKREVVAYQSIVRQNAQILPTDAELTIFLRFLASLDKDTGVTLRSVPNYTPQTSARGGIAGITRIPMSLQLSGSTRAFLRFLNEMERYDRLVSVTDFRFSPGDEKDAQGGEIEHDVTVKFEIYRYDPKAAGKDLAEILRPSEIEDLRANDPAVKKILAEKSKPARIEKYQLLPGRDGRRDPFVDPRRRVGPGVGPDRGDQDPAKAEEALLEVLGVQLERARNCLDTYKLAKQRGDYLLMAANKRLFEQARGELEENLRRVTAKPFSNRQMQDRYATEIDRPYRALVEEANLEFGPGEGPGGGKGLQVSLVLVRGALKDMHDLIGARDWDKAHEKLLNVEQLVKDAKDNVEEPARAPLAELRKLGLRAQNQAAFAKKPLKFQGFVRMPGKSAVILDGKTYMQGDRLDADTVFLGVSDDGRVLFTLQGNEVDFVPEKPKLIPMNKAMLGRE
jgi:Tfp pilus assembly protein PilO